MSTKTTISPMRSVLDTNNLKPYWKLGKLIDYAMLEGIITPNEAERFEEELDLLEKGINRSSVTVPRSVVPDPID